MNGKRLLLLAAFGALATFAAPGLAGTVANQANITVQWNAQPIASMTVVTNYNGATTQSGSAPTIVAGGTGSTASTCTAAGGGIEASTTTANFGNVTPNASNVNYCLYKNGVNVNYSTTDSTNYTIGEQAVATTVTGGTYGAGGNYALCLYDNGAIPTAAFTNSARGAVPNTTDAVGACSSAGGHQVLTASATNLVNTAGPAAAKNVGEDIELEMGANAPSGADNVTLQWTLTDN